MRVNTLVFVCLLYTSDAADEDRSVDLGGRRIIKKNFFKQKTAYEILACLVGSEMCIRDSPYTHTHSFNQFLEIGRRYYHIQTDSTLPAVVAAQTSEKQKHFL